ncbi:hypothetical protein GPJ56_010498 [Histomonas meleagridis]|uniref:uncharacterized protein n=1 Tax=Histomonas meleagridis TaxID=135588 RepID=UPI003559EEC9|nr:hypothetical protein GPJ56_010498 [Histomonas meleagridis]KAH0798025.1 hypothetical protein GO595_009138 [Histomonas meleagridis]
MGKSDNSKHISIDTESFNQFTIDSPQHEITLTSLKNSEKIRVQFHNSFYFSTFFAQLSNYYILEYQSTDNYLISPIVIQQHPQHRFNPLIKETLLTKVNDLYAHQSLLEYLGLPFDGTGTYHSSVLPFEDSLIDNFVTSPFDPEIRQKISQTKIPRQYFPLVLVLLLIDKPETNHDEKSTFPNCMVNIEPIPKGVKKIPVIDDLVIGGSYDIVGDFEALKLQWTTVTSTQLLHANRFKISLKLLENILIASFPSAHPIIRIIFDALSSFFMISDELETFNNEMFKIMNSVAQLFISPDLVIGIEPTDIEHFIFWIFYSLVKKIGLIKVHEEKESLINRTMTTIIHHHPLLYNLLTKDMKSRDDISCLKFLDNYLMSLFSHVLDVDKMMTIWIAALATDEPMDFMCNFLAISMIMVFPQIVDAENVTEELKKALTKYFEENEAEVLFSNTLKINAITKLNE